MKVFNEILRKVKHSNIGVWLFFFSCYSSFAQMNKPVEPVGGEKLLKDFIKQEMIYPITALNNKVEGEVVITFKVKPDGSVVDANITKSVNSEIDKEALRIFRKILWEPATDISGKITAISSFYCKFNIKQYKRWVKQRGYEQLPYPSIYDTTNKIYQYIQLETAPRPFFKDSSYNYSKFMSDNLKYPEEAFRQSIEGDVKLSFVVEPYGKVSNIKVVQHVGGGCSEEAIRLLKLLDWKPGTVKGMAVRTAMSLTIRFALNNSNFQYVPSNSSMMN